MHRQYAAKREKVLKEIQAISYDRDPYDLKMEVRYDPICDLLIVEDTYGGHAEVEYTRYRPDNAVPIYNQLVLTRKSPAGKAIKSDELPLGKAITATKSCAVATQAEGDLYGLMIETQKLGAKLLRGTP